MGKAPLYTRAKILPWFDSFQRQLALRPPANHDLKNLLKRLELLRAGSRILKSLVHHSNVSIRFHQAGQANLIVSMLLAVAATAVAAVVMYLALLRGRIRSESYVMVMSLAAALFASEVMALKYGVSATVVSASDARTANARSVSS